MAHQYPEQELLLGPSSPGEVAVSGDVSVITSGVGMKLAKPAYDSASRVDQLGDWAAPIRSADADLLDDKQLLDARARDMTRNDAYVAGGATLHKDNIVGSVYLLNAKPNTKGLFGKDDEVWETEFQEEAETLFMATAESPMHWLDAKRTKTLTAIVRLAVAVDTSGGEVLMTGEWMPNDGRPNRTAVQMIDADRLSTPYNKYGDKTIRGGVERDRYGAPDAYHIRQAHPSDYFDAESYLWKRVPARKPWGRQMVLHIFEENRADQSRGISAMVAALMEMKMTKGIRKVELQRAVVASTYAASMESDLPGDQALAVMGGGDGVSIGDGVTDYMFDVMNAMREYVGGSRSLTIDGNRIPIMPPGTSLKLQNPGNTGPQGDKFEQSLLRYIAASLGVSYEQLSRDYTNTNYSSARAAVGETWKHMLSRKKRVADRTANFVYRLWLEEQINRGTLTTMKRPNMPSWYEGLNAEFYSNCDWLGAGRGMIDPLKETQALILQINNRLTTREMALGQIHGIDWRQVPRQFKRELALDEKNGLEPIIQSPAENALSGTPQERDGQNQQDA